MMEHMKLVHPHIDWEASFVEALAEFDREQILGFWNYRLPILSVSEYIERTKINARGEGLPLGMVPSHTFWLIDNDEFVGHVNIRHHLTPRLTLIGGHIGYAVRPSMHSKGYGSALLKLALPQAKMLGIRQPLITCDPPNIASRKIIEKNGGVLRDEVVVDGRPILRFDIQVVAKRSVTFSEVSP